MSSSGLLRASQKSATPSVPMAQMFGYSTAIRSLTKGRASYSMEPDMFEVAPKNVRDAILAM